MNKILYSVTTTLLFFLFIGNSFAQQANRVSISGIVSEQETKEPILQATVRLFALPDSTLKAGTFTNASGVFVIKDIPKGSYVVEISYMGLQTLLHPIKVDNKNIDLPALELLPSSILLKEAVVTGYITDVIVKQDTIEYNADSFKTPPGSVVEDLLKKLPGVEVDEEGKISVAGKEVKKIYVDGKEFFGSDPKVTTKNLPTDIVNKLQVVDRKSELAQLTGIDDGEDEKIINITLKPGMKNGWFGSAVAGAGTKVNDEYRYELSGMVTRIKENNRTTLLGNANNTNNQAFSDLGGDLVPQINIRTRGRGRGGASGSSGITQAGNLGINVNNVFSDKLTMDGSFVYGKSATETSSISHVQNIMPDSVFYNRDTIFNREAKDKSVFELRMVYKPDSLTTINFRPTAYYEPTESTENSSSETRDGSPLQLLENQSKMISSTTGEGYNISGVLDISRGSRTKKGRKATVSLSGGINNGNSDGDIYSKTDYYDRKTGNIRRSVINDQIQDNKNQGYNYRLYASYVEPFSTNRFLQLSYSVRVNNSDSQRNTYSRDTLTNDYTVLDTAYSNSFLNYFVNQQINASIRTIREKYDYTVGIEMSPSYSNSERYIGDTVLLYRERNVINYSPVASIRYRFSGQESLQFEYRGQTSQPSMNQLDPTRDISNPLKHKEGNADLKPSYTHRVNFRYNNSIREKQQSLSVNGNFNYIMNGIANKSRYEMYADSTGVWVNRPENVNGSWNARLSAFFNSPLKNPKFRINSNFSSSYSSSKGFIDDLENTSKVLSLSETAGFSFRSKIFDAGTRINVRYGNTANTLGRQNDQSTFDYGLGGNFTLTLPHNIVLASDINHTKRSGYLSGYSLSETLWNAEISTRFLKNNQATVKFKIYDILKDRKNIYRSSSENNITDTRYNSLTSYCMLYFAYSFNSFGGQKPTIERERRVYRGDGGGEGMF